MQENDIFMTKIKPLQTLKLKLQNCFSLRNLSKLKKEWMVSLIQLLFRPNFSDKLIKTLFLFQIYCPLSGRGKSFGLKAEVGMTIIAVCALLFFMSAVFVWTTGIVFSCDHCVLVLIWKKMRLSVRTKQLSFFVGSYQLKTLHNDTWLCYFS